MAEVVAAAAVRGAMRKRKWCMAFLYANTHICNNDLENCPDVHHELANLALCGLGR